MEKIDVFSNFFDIIHDISLFKESILMDYRSYDVIARCFRCKQSKHKKKCQITDFVRVEFNFPYVIVVIYGFGLNMVATWILVLENRQFRLSDIETKTNLFMNSS